MPSASASTDPSGPRRTTFWAWLFSPKGELAASLTAGGLLLVGFVLIHAAGLSAGQAFYWVALAIGFVHGGRAALGALAEKKFDIDVLMIVGAGMAAYLNAPGEGALLLFLFVLAGALEELAMAKTTRAVEALHKLMPTAALRQTPTGEFEEVSPDDLKADDVVKVLPGESVPADGVLLSASDMKAEGLSPSVRGSGLVSKTGEHDDETAALDQSTLTGESMPRVVRPGEEVYAGTINAADAIRVRVLRPAAESSLQRVLDLVISAQRQREPVQRAIDRLSQPYAIGVMMVSVLVLLVWWLVLGEPLLGTSEHPESGALYTAITLLVVMSPCAVIISTPTATLCAIARAARGGVLFKGGQAIERLSRIGALALDKTGTLTMGRPSVIGVHAVGWSDADKLLATAAGLEAESTHPIARAIIDAAKTRHVTPLSAGRLRFIPGGGVVGTFDGCEARIGTYEHALPLVPECLRAQAERVLASVRQEGCIAVVIAHDQQAAVVVIADPIRPGAAGLAAGLAELGVAPVCMLTGDNEATAQAVAGRLGIARYRAEMLPADKVEAIATLKEEVRTDGYRPAWRRGVGVIGDGVNDAPALAAADVSVAVGTIGSDAAMESADVVLLSEDLHTLPWAVALARRARRTIIANLTFALSAIGLMALATLVGSRTGWRFPLWAGVLGHEGGTLLVVANSLLLLFAKGVLRPRAGAEFGSTSPQRQQGSVHELHETEPSTSASLAGEDYSGFEA